MHASFVFFWGFGQAWPRPVYLQEVYKLGRVGNGAVASSRIQVTDDREEGRKGGRGEKQLYSFAVTLLYTTPQPCPCSCPQCNSICKLQIALLQTLGCSSSTL